MAAILFCGGHLENDIIPSGPWFYFNVLAR